MKKQLIFGIIFLIGIFLISNLFAYEYSIPQSTIPGSSFGFFGGSASEEIKCEPGNDFIIQIAPFGCQPAVVRSDLLEEQDTAILCQLSATKINPLIKVEAIKDISFSGNYPKEIKSVAFYPAKSALGTGIFSDDAQLESGFFDNIGYVQIVLKRQKNESSMPKAVTGKLTATIEYDIENAFGLGKATFYLPEVDDVEWEKNKGYYSLWKGRAFLKADNIDTDSATISLYDGNRKLASANLKRGDQSNMIYLPGFDCLAGLKLRLDGLNVPDTLAKLDVNGEKFELLKSERFLDNKCTVQGFDKKGLIEEVNIKCDTDEKKGEKFTLKMSPKVKLEIQGITLGCPEDGCRIGDLLYPEADRNVFLAHIGENKSGEKFVMLAITKHPNREEFLKSIDYDFAEDLANSRTDLDNPKALDLVKALLTGGIDNANAIGRGSGFTSRIFEGQTKEIKFTIGKVFEIPKSLTFSKFSDPQDSTLPENVSVVYDKAINNYDSVLNSFAVTKYPNTDKNTKTKGQEALEGKISLAFRTQQFKAMFEFCGNFKEMFPTLELPSECSEKTFANSEISSVSFAVNGRIKQVSLLGIYEPSFEDFGAVVALTGAGANYDGDFELEKGRKIYFNETDYFELKEVNDDSIKVSITEAGSTSNNVPIDLKTSIVFGSKKNYQLSLRQIKLNEQAKVSVIPKINNAGGNASFGFSIGIEKRAIQLSPAQTKKKIDDLNRNIPKLEKITNNLGTLVSGMKKVCMGTSAVLFVKAIINGKNLARTRVMSGQNGWYNYCEEKSREGQNKIYNSVDECLIAKSSEIEKDVGTYDALITEQNNQIKLLEKDCMVKNTWGNVINSSCLKQRYFNETYKTNLINDLENRGITTVKGKDVRTFVNDLNYESLSVEEIKALEINSKLSGGVLGDLGTGQMNKSLIDIFINTDLERQRLASALEKGISLNDWLLITGKDSKSEIYSGKKYNDIDKAKWHIGGERADNPPVQAILFSENGKLTEYLAILKEVNGQYAIEEVYNRNGVEPPENEIKKLNFRLEPITENTYKNKYLNAELRYFETEPYKGMPAIVPFDLKEGWYAATSQSSALRSYDDSGRVNSFWLCNVGANGKEEFLLGNDECMQFNTATGQTRKSLSGLNPIVAEQKIAQAEDAIYKASTLQDRSGGKEWEFNKQRIPIGTPVTGRPDIRCTDFLSAVDCNLMFNACDPVMCPSSRCDFNGKYPVDNVIQSGVFGSLLLCLPNFGSPASGGVVIPVCLSGVQAGLDGWLTVQKSYRDCLQKSLDTGETVGICDEMNGVYKCELFWKQFTPLVKYGVPSFIDLIKGKSRGGGEYLTPKDTFANADKSIDYFTQYYADDSFKAFKARNSEEIGGEVCKNYASVIFPSSGNILDSLTEPDSPTQFYGKFEEIPFTTATSPPVSQYKVFYHIYAGKDRGAYYQVYLKVPEGTSYYEGMNYRRIVASNYLGAGEYVSETPDFTAVAGYKQLCIRVNEQEECGFQQVTTDAGINYIRDQYIKEQAGTKVTTEKACVSGTSSLSAINSLNMENNANNLINPQIYNYGIIRICATDNPGLGNDVNVDKKNMRWIEVGYCGDERMKCWLDQESVNKAVNWNISAGQGTKEVVDAALDEMRKNAMSDSDFDTLVSKENLDGKTPLDVISLIGQNFPRIFQDIQKGHLYYLRGKAYADIATGAYDKFKEAIAAITPPSNVEVPGQEEVPGEEREGVVIISGPVEPGLIDENIVGYVVFEFQDGTVSNNLYYRYFNGNWWWSPDKKSWILPDKPTSAVADISIRDGIFLESLISVQNNYRLGLGMLVNRTVVNLETNPSPLGCFFGQCTKLITDAVQMDQGGEFKFKEKIVGKSLYLKFLVKEKSSEGNMLDLPGKWVWSNDGTQYYPFVKTNRSTDIITNDGSLTVDWDYYHNAIQTSKLTLLAGDTLGFRKGAALIFDFNKIIEYPVQERTEAKSLVVGNRAITNNVIDSKCKEYFNLIVDASTANKIPDPLLLLALMKHESSCEKDGVHKNIRNGVVDSLDVGLMQINTKVHCTAENGLPTDQTRCAEILKSDIKKNVFLGASILKKGYDDFKKGKPYTVCGRNIVYTEWEAALRAYNGWGCYPGQGHYVEDVLKVYNEIINSA